MGQSISCQNCSVAYGVQGPARRSQSHPPLILSPGQSCLTLATRLGVAVISALQETLTGTRDSVSFLVVELVTARCRYQRRLLFKVRERLGEKRKSRRKEMEKGAGWGVGGEEGWRGRGKRRGGREWKDERAWLGRKKRKRKRKENSRYSWTETECQMLLRSLVTFHHQAQLNLCTWVPRDAFLLLTISSH